MPSQKRMNTAKPPSLPESIVTAILTITQPGRYRFQAYRWAHGEAPPGSQTVPDPDTGQDLELRITEAEPVTPTFALRLASV